MTPFDGFHVLSEGEMRGPGRVLGLWLKRANATSLMQRLTRALCEAILNGQVRLLPQIAA